MATLAPGNVLRTPVVNGADLRAKRGLLPEAIYRRPYIPGARLLNTNDEEIIRAELVNLNDLATVKATLADSFGRTWQDLYNEAGTGGMQLQLDDPDNDEFDEDGTDVVLMYYRGQQAFQLVVDAVKRVRVADDPKDEVVTYSGLGALGLFRKSILDPTGGPYRSPIEEDRHLGWSSESFDHSPWDYAQMIGIVQDAINIGAALILGLATGGPIDPFSPFLGELIEFMTEQVTRTIPTTFIPLYAAPGSSMQNAPEGTCYFYEDATGNPNLNIPAEGDYLFVGFADDEADFFINGIRITSVQGLNWLGLTSVVVTLSAGPCSVAARVTNLHNSQLYNPLKYGWVIATETQTHNLFDTDSSFFVVATASGNTRIMAYPPEPPGQPITKTIRIIKEEQEARGRWPSSVVLGFDDDTFSDGSTAPKIPDFASKVSTNDYNLLREIAGSYADISVVVQTVDGVRKFVLQLWPKGSRGVTRGAAATLDETNVDSWTEDSELLDFGRLLVKSDFGWSEHIESETGGETVIEIGAPVTPEEVARMAAAAIREVNDPKTQITVGVTPNGPDDAPYTGYTVADLIPTAYTGAEQIVGITFSEDPDDGKTQEELMLRDLILSPEQRQSLELDKAL